jgi:hypothetical protein
MLGYPIDNAAAAAEGTKERRKSRYIEQVIRSIILYFHGQRVDLRFEFIAMLPV